MQCPVAHDPKASVPAGHPSVPNDTASNGNGNGYGKASGVKVNTTAARLRGAANGPTSASTPSGSGSATPSTPLDAGFEPNAPASVVPSADLTLAQLLYESGAGDGTSASVDDWPLPVGLDLSAPVADLLREGTQRAHVAAENSQGAIALTNGQLEIQEYIRWLALLWRVYDALENALDAHSSNSVLEPTYDPKVLARAPELAADIRFLLRLVPKAEAAPSANLLASAPAGPLPPFPLPPFLEEVFTSTPAPLAVYLDRLHQLGADDASAPRLLAHAYVRYLGDLSGGQVIGSRLRKAYCLQGLDGRRFYYFDRTGGDTAAAEAGEETVGERKKKLQAIKNWYRSGMNEGAGEDKQLKATLVREANVAFVLNTHLFSLIRAPTRELRYFEKQILDKERMAILYPPKPVTWAERAVQFAYFIAAVFMGVFIVHVFIPTIVPILEPHFERHVLPILERTLFPFWNKAVVPWWERASPVMSRMVVAGRRRMF